MAGTSLGTAYVQITPSARGIKGSITNTLGGEAKSAGTSVGSKIGAFAKKAIVAAGIGTALVGVIKGAMSEGAKLQQSYLGGLDTLYGDAADGARAYAREAANAGISMNEYSEQAVSFGAALKAAYGGDTTKAMETANTAILDMADNAAKMGTPLESIQNAYQGFAKQNYTMLDNLKLGYGGTKSEMERLLADAQELTGVEYNIDNLGDVYDAIHAIQGNLGLTGVAAKEASETFSGSFAAMKASAQNVLGSLALGENLQPALSNLLSTVDTFVFNNLIPMITTIVRNLPTLIWTVFTEGIPMLVEHAVNFLSEAAANLGTLAEGLTTEKVKTWAVETIPKLLTAAGQLISKLAKGFIDNLPKIVVAIGTIAKNIVYGLGQAIWPKVREAANRIKEKFLAPINALRERVNSVIQSLKNGFMSKVYAIRDTIGSVASSIKEKFLSPIRALRDKISSIIEAIKGFFSFSVSAPHIPLPHFSISPAGWGLGDLLHGSLPHLGISWYAKGGIADSPAIVGIGEGTSSEAILPLDPFWKKMDKIADSIDNNSRGGDVTINVYATPGMDVNALAEAVERKFIDTQKRRRLAWG